MPTPGCSDDGDGGRELEWIMSGFRACAQETMRFLIEDERLPGNDPMVLGLWRYLAQQELIMDLDSVLSQQAAEGEPAMPEPPVEAPLGVPDPEEEAAREVLDELLKSIEEQQPSDPQSHLAAVYPVVVPHVNSDHNAAGKPSTAEPNTREQGC